MYSYHAFTLAIASALEIPEFLPTPKQPVDVTITFGPLPKHLPDATVTHGPWQAKPGAFQINIDGVAQFFVTGGNHIVINKAPQASLPDIRNFLLGSAMAALLQQRALLTLHASAVQTAKGAVLFLGKSGYGKSTLMQQLGTRGFTMISDDICAISRASDGSPIALPSFPRTRLTPQSLEILQKPCDHEIIGSSIKKYNVPVAQICNQPQPLHALCFLDLGPEPTPTITSLPKPKALQEVMRLTYRANFMKAMGLHKTQFDLASAVTRSADFYHIKRPAHAASYDALINLVIDTLGLT